MYPPVGPIIFQAGPIALRWYGLLLVTGMMVATWMASRHVTRKGYDGEKVWDLLVWVLIPGLIGARLYYVFIQSPRGPEGFGRFFIEFIRTDSWFFPGTPFNFVHLLSAVAVTTAALTLYLRHRNRYASVNV